jgi:hypothetical protein
MCILSFRLKVWIIIIKTIRIDQAHSTAGEIIHEHGLVLIRIRVPGRTGAGSTEFPVIDEFPFIFGKRSDTIRLALNPGKSYFLFCLETGRIVQTVRITKEEKIVITDSSFTKNCELSW